MSRATDHRSEQFPLGDASKVSLRAHVIEANHVLYVDLWWLYCARIMNKLTLTEQPHSRILPDMPAYNVLAREVGIHMITTDHGAFGDGTPPTKPQPSRACQVGYRI